MCHHCVIDSVKERMLSRRDLFKTGLSGAAAAGAVATGMTTTSAFAGGHGAKTAIGEIVDLSHKLSPEFPTFFGEPGISMKPRFEFAKDGFNVFDLTLVEHTATHIDAPLHFSADGKSVDEITASELVVPLVVVDIKEKAAADPDAQVTPDDLKAWIAKNGDLPDKCCVAMNSGWSAFTADHDKYKGTKDGKRHHPGFHVEATQMLLEQSTASAIGVDTLSLDYGPSEDFATHYAWLPAGRYGIENLANLDAVPEAGATVIIGAMNHVGGTGGYARIFAAM